MLRNKRGQIFLSLLLIILALVVFLFFLSQENNGAVLVANAPDSVRSAIDVMYNIFEPITRGLFWLVAPAGEEENVQVIAFSIFLLLWLVGTQTLRVFFTPGLSFLISGIIGIIAGRSLTATVLEETALGASPIATTVFLLGFLPILMVKGLLDKTFYRHLTWEEDKTRSSWLGQISAEGTKVMLMRTAAWVLLAFVYFFVFSTEYFDARRLGIFYAIGIIIFAIGDVIYPIIDQKRRALRAQQTGQFIGAAGRLKQWWYGAASGAQRNQRILGP